jgi:hypothetical protein
VTLPARRVVNAYYAIVAERLTLADCISPTTEGEPTRLAQFEQMVNEPLPTARHWGEGDQAEAEMAAAMALLGGG